MDTTWFREALDAKGISQRSLALSMGLDQAAVSLMFRGKRAMSLAEAASVAEKLGLGLMDVIRKAGISVKEAVSNVKITHRTDSTGTVHQLSEDAFLEIDAPVGAPVGSYAIQVRDAADLRDHAVYVISGHAMSSFTGKALMAHVQSEDGSGYLGYLCKGYTHDSYRLISVENRVIKDSVILAAVHPVLWVNPRGA